MKALRKVIHLISMMAVVLLVTHCGGGDGGKGDESEMPIDGSADAWRSPTDHGVIAFGVQSEAEFKEGSLYHAWNFTLGGAADVTILVNPMGSDNFDTVMYLYKRQPGTTSWGQYIARNDDYQENQWSGLERKLDAAEYRVMLKGFKKSLRGKFSITVTCAGEGCGESPTCSDELYRGLPSTALSATCVAKIQAVMNAPVTQTSSFTIAKKDRCNLPEVGQMAWDYYYLWWEEMGESWEDDERGNGEPLAFEVELTGFGSVGSLVRVNYPFSDEMAMVFLFDRSNKMLSFFQANQSPTIDFFCGESQEQDLGSPDEDCFGAFMMDYRTSEPDKEVTGSAYLGDVNGWLGNKVEKAALMLYTADMFGQLVPDMEQANYSYVRWNSNWVGSIYHFTIQEVYENGSSIEYWIATGEYNNYLYYSVKDGVTQFRCQDIEIEKE